jgi:hypothetical protein
MGKLRLIGETGDTHSHFESDIADGSLLARLAADEAITGAWDFSSGKIRLTQGLDANKPGSGNTEGDVWWATDTDKLYIWDGVAWKSIGAGNGGSGLVNLIQNGGFEETHLPTTNTPSGWALEGAPTSVAPSADVAADAGGARSILIGAAAVNQGIKQTLKNLKANTQYYVYTRAKATSGATARLLSTGAGANIDQTTTSTSWTTLSGAFITDGSGTDVVLKLVESVLGTGVYFDDVLVVEGPGAAPFAPNPWDYLLKAVDSQDLTTNRDYSRLRLETGRLEMTGNGTETQVGTATFSQAFTKFLGAVATCQDSRLVTGINTYGTSSIEIRLRDYQAAVWSGSEEVFWFAIGVD